MFKYQIRLLLTFDDGEVDTSIPWKTDVQLSAGDFVWFNYDLERLEVERVVWYIDAPNTAFVQMRVARIPDSVGNAEKWTKKELPQPLIEDEDEAES